MDTKKFVFEIVLVLVLRPRLFDYENEDEEEDDESKIKSALANSLGHGRRDQRVNRQAGLHPGADFR
jgi:hypothetical protein